MAVTFVWYLSVYTGCIVSVLAADKNTVCPPWVGSTDYRPFTSDDSSMCYIHVDHKVNWHQANSMCSEAGWRLLKIPSQLVQSFFERNFESITKYNCFWIGLSDYQDEDDFRWTDGGSLQNTKHCQSSTRSLNSFGISNDFSVLIGTPMQYTLLQSQNVISKWTFDCVAFCSKILSAGFQWQTKACTAWDTNWDFVCEIDALKITTPASKTTVSVSSQKNDRPRRKHDVIGFAKMVNFCNMKLETQPEFSSWCRIVSACARECARNLSPCALFNFQASSGTCHGYSSVDVLAGPKQQAYGWQFYVQHQWIV